jgi:3-oxoacyl-[acyl-carrier protein] reductase
MADELQGLNAIVCGSTQGIGRACALEFARRGAAVALLARDAEALEKTLAELPGAGHSALVADFSNPEAVRAAAERHAGKVGVVHVLLNNTGGPPAGPLLEATPPMFLAAFTAHLLCSHLLVQTVVPGMKRAGYGRIVNVISTSVKQPIAGLGVSNTIRGAMAAWAKTLSGELGPFGITVNNLLPGYTGTKRLEFVVAARAQASGRSGEEVERHMTAEIPAGRFGRAEELAAVAAFLAGPSASYVNGVSIPVDGGRTTAL